MTQPVFQTKYNDWLIYAAFLPAVLTLVGIGVTTAIAWRSHALWNAATLSAIQGDADDYIQGLARRGIVKLPGYEPPPAAVHEPALAVDLVAGP